MKSDTLENSMFTIITDMDGKVLSEEELKKMQLEGLIRLLHEKIKRIDYLHEDDRRMLLYLARAINEKIEF
jgi:hypothetical protein